MQQCACLRTFRGATVIAGATLPWFYLVCPVCLITQGDAVRFGLQTWQGSI